MKRIFILKVFLVSFIFLGVGLTLLLSTQEKATPENSVPAIKEYSPGLLKITGFQQRTYNNRRLASLVKADEFKVMPRKQHFLFNMSPIINIRPIFNIRPFNEASFKNAKLEVHLRPEPSAENGLFFIGKNMLTSDLKGMGIITRVSIQGLSMDIYKDDILKLVLASDKARVDLRKKEVKLINATIKDQLTGKIIMSNVVVWDENEKFFNIPGPYIAITSKGKTIGKGIRLNLDFKPIPFI
jgi:hypothetical protein